jgi:hypothetical protein
MYERMDRKTRHHRWLGRLFYRHNIGENVMREFCNGELIVILTVVLLGMAVIYTVQPAKEDIKPVLQGQMK